MGCCVSKEHAAPPSSAGPVKGKEPEASPSGASGGVPNVVPQEPPKNPPQEPPKVPQEPSKVPQGPPKVPQEPPKVPQEPPKETEAERDEKLRKIFLQVDKDNSGFVDASELKALLGRMNLSVDDENVRFMMSRYNDDKNGKLNIEEFSEMVLSITEVKKQFEKADKDKSGSINPSEMQALLAAKQLSPEVAKELLLVFDQDGNGLIEYREFVALSFYVNELEYQHKAFEQRKGADFSWLTPMLGPENAGKTNEVARLLVEMRTQKPYPPLNEFAKIVVKAAEGPNWPTGHKKAPLILAQRARVRPPPRKVMKVQKSQFIEFKHTGEPFVDLSFKPAIDILTPKAQGVVKEWKRIKEINADAMLFVDGVDEGDVIQGGLGDCWFLGALAVVATSAENFIEHLFVQQMPEIGYYQIRFFKNGKWVLVEVDDRLPVNSSGNLVYASCKDPREFWVPIVEKAYAKLHGSYAAIESGSISDALKDLTGEGIEITHLDSPVFQKDHDLAWKHLLHNAGESFLMGCAIEDPKSNSEHQLDCGLLTGHAYSIINCQNVHGNKLIRMRNPWGHGEWNGAWADFSKEWNTSLQKELGYQFANDGTFFISFADFIKFYSRVYVLRLLTDTTGEVWSKAEFNGEWKGETAAGCANHHNWLNNPQYALKIKNPDTKVFINLSQPDLRYVLKKSLASVAKEYDAIGLYILSAKDLRFRKVVAEQEEKVATSPFTNVRDLSFECTLGAGDYVVVPCTFDEKLQLAYDLALYSNKPVEMSPLTAMMPTKSAAGEWKGDTAGGCANNRDTWMKNPQFLLVCSSAGSVEIHLTQEEIPHKELEAVGIYVFGSPIKSRVDQAQLLLQKPSNIINLPTLTETLTVAANANYVIMPTTFESGLEKKFTLSVTSVNATIAEFRPL